MTVSILVVDDETELSFQNGNDVFLKARRE
jgi:hypothetical protein